jgi:hypothetical protein
MSSEEERVREAMFNMQRGESLGHKLKYHPESRTIRPVGPTEDPDEEFTINQEDAEFFGGRQDR